VPLTGPTTSQRAFQGRGGFYLDPSTGVKVYKLTSATFPAAGANWGHDYSEGRDEVSLPYNGTTRRSSSTAGRRTGSSTSPRESESATHGH